MPHIEERLSTADGLALYLQGWRPDEKCRAAVAIVHGINEHGGRYARLAGDLNRQGVAVYALDLRGHGRSEGERAWIVSFDQFLDDVETLLRLVREKEPNVPVFLFGHSLGGLIVTWAALNRPLDARGLILSSPALSVGGKVFPILRRLAAFFSAVWPKMRFVQMGYHFMSHDPRVAEDFKNDPLVYHGKFPVRTGAEILRVAKLAQQRFEKIRLPLLIMHGTHDVVTDPRGSRLLYTRAGAADKTLHLYEGLLHEIFNEPERDRIVADLLAWLNARVESRLE
jgi:alpha-beta hydrolase superfamily lysophospholipase